MKASDLYVSVTNRIISDIEKGVLPWQKPWTVTRSNGIGIMPTNAATGRPYSGINIPLLWFAVQDAGYPSHGWMTFKQAHEMGAQVRKGEKATSVVFTQWVEKDGGDGDEKEKRPVMRVYYVFNLAQLDNLPATFREPPTPVPDEIPYDAALRTLNECSVPIEYRGNQACYIPSRDIIEMPPYGSFKTDEGFYATAFHELTHATGHPNRLNRRFGKRFGDEVYAFEELVAELGSAFLCAHHDIAPSNSSDAAYIQGWLKVLKADNRAIFTAASHASQAADWVRTQVKAEETYGVTEHTPECERPKDTPENVVAFARKPAMALSREMDDEIPF